MRTNPATTLTMRTHHGRLVGASLRSSFQLAYRYVSKRHLQPTNADESTLITNRQIEDEINRNKKHPKAIYRVAQKTGPPYLIANILKIS